jgi:hypothetical protein
MEILKEICFRISKERKDNVKNKNKHSPYQGYPSISTKVMDSLLEVELFLGGSQ